jgi:hypothetical protein
MVVDIPDSVVEAAYELTDERLKDLYGVEPGQPEDGEVFGRDYLVPAGILNQHGRVLSIVEPMPGDRLE